MLDFYNYGQCVQKKRDQNVLNIFYKTQVSLIKFGTPFLE